MIKRRTFLQLLSIPALAALWPRASQAQAGDGPFYTDDLGTADLAPVHDNDLATSAIYGA